MTIRQKSGVCFKLFSRGFVLFAAFLVSLAFFASAGKALAQDESVKKELPYKVVVYSQPYNHYKEMTEYSRLFQEDLQRRWGDLVELRYMKSDFVNRREEISADIESLADDPKVRGVVIGEGLPGTLDGIIKLRTRRPDIFVIVIDPHEDQETTAKVATLTVTLNHAARGYIFPTMASRMGARTMVLFSIPRHQAIPYLARQSRIMNAVSRDMGMIMVTDLNAPDPGSGDNRAEIKAYFEKAVDSYFQRYGKDIAFVATSTVHNDILTPIIMERGGNLLDAVQSSPLLGYPEALGLTKEAVELFGQWHELLTIEDEKIMELQPPGGFTLWTYPYPHTVVLSMIDLVVGALDNQADIYDLRSVSSALEKYSPGVKWLVSTIMNYETNTVLPQAVLVLQDTYWFGHGYQGFTRLNIPTQYYRIQ